MYKMKPFFLKYIWLFLLINIVVSIWSQETQEKVLSDLFGFYSENEEIPADFLISNFDSTFGEKIISFAKALEVVRLDSSITFLMEIVYPWDDAVSDYFALTFSNNGFCKKISNLASTFESPRGNNYYSTYKVFFDTIIQFKTMTDNINYYSIYFINNYGAKKYSFYSHPSSGRKNKLSSLKILSNDELLKKNKDELDIMRNEIYADHGYIFKKKKWIKYFSNKEWYKPRYKDVNGQMNLIEKINISNILKVSSMED